MRIVLKPTGIGLILLGIVVLTALALRPRPVAVSPAAADTPLPAATAHPPATPAPIGADAIYSHALANDWTDASSAKVSDNDTKFSRIGASIRVDAGPNQALILRHAPLNIAEYDRIAIRINGGKEGGQTLKLTAQYGDGSQTTTGPDVALPHLIPGPWRPVAISLKELGVAGHTDLTGFTIQDAGGQGVVPTFYIGEMRLLHPQDPTL